MTDNHATPFKPKPAPRDRQAGPAVRIHPPANDNRTGRLARIAAIVAVTVVLLWLFSD